MSADTHFSNHWVKSVQIRTRKNSVFGHISHSECATVSLISSSSSSHISESETSSSSSSSDSERKKREKSKKKKSKKDKTKRSKNRKKPKKSNRTRFEVILGNNKNFWDLPESKLGYVIEHFKKYI